MDYVVLGVRLLLMFFSNLGYWTYIRKKININIYFLPVITIALQISFLFAAGLLNILNETAYIIFFSGLILFGRDIYKNGIKGYSVYKNWGYFYILFCLIMLMIAVNGCSFSHYDNFSHWALVVKEMLLTNQYPNFTNEVIQFQEYPLGSATYIYYFSKFISKGENIQMLAQAYMMLTCMLPLFVFSKKNSKKIYLFIYLLFLTNLIFIFITPITELLVDTVLPLFGMVMLTWAYYECYIPLYKERQNIIQDENKINLKIFCLVVLMISTVLIKNSGVYFLVIGYFLLYKLFKKNHKIRKMVFISIAIPFGVLVLWKKHCEYVFYDALRSRHAMTFANYRNQIMDKDLASVKIIITELVKYIFHDARLLWFIVIPIILLGIITYLLKTEMLKRYMGFIRIGVLLYVLYIIGLICMYIFSMPIKEAIYVAGVTRYEGSILIALIYLFSIYGIELFSEIYETKNFLNVYIAIVLVLLFSWSHVFRCDTIFHTKYSSEERKWMKKNIEEYRIPAQASYMIACPKGKNKASYFYHMAVYLFRTRNIDARIIETPEDLKGFNEYRYIFIMDMNNELLNNWIMQEYSEQYGNEVIITSKLGGKYEE